MDGSDAGTSSWSWFRSGVWWRMVTRVAAILLVLLACQRETPPTPQSGEVSTEARARGAALIGELKRSLVGALTKAMGSGLPAAISTCHTEAPVLTAAVARAGATVGRATRKPRNPGNAATGWQADALTQFESVIAAGKPLAGQTFARQLPSGRIAYAEPLVIQELCVTCHGATLAPEVKAEIAARYPDDRATGYAVGDLRGVAWVELPANERPAAR